MPVLSVKGMSCNHCRQAVTKALESFPGVSDVVVNLETGVVSWNETAPIDVTKIKKAISKLGFDVE